MTTVNGYGKDFDRMNGSLDNYFALAVVGISFKITAMFLEHRDPYAPAMTYQGLLYYWQLP